jgi:hypothetical protein
VLATCLMFIIGTCDVAFTIWIDFLAIRLDLNDTQTFILFNNSYIIYVAAHVRHILSEVMICKLTAFLHARKLLFTCRYSSQMAYL